MLNKKNFQTTYNNKDISLFTIKNTQDIFVSITNFGARVVELWLPDKNNNFADVVLGHNSIDEYINTTGERFFGATCGRYANRIAKGEFVLNGKKYNTPINNDGNTLHGGIKGFDSVIWTVDNISDYKIDFSYISKDGEEGFPGNLTVQMSYELTDDNELIITYKANTDEPTYVNLTHHSFFNLKGEGQGTINDHILYIPAEEFTPVDKNMIPFGDYKTVKNTPLDFTKPTQIGKNINKPYDQLEIAGGYDHNWIISKEDKKNLELAATVLEPKSGRFMEVFTNQPGIQFYGGNSLSGKEKSKDGKNIYEKQGAFALETQHFPNSLNTPSFPNTLLNPEDEYYHICKYKFSVKDN